MFDMSRDEDGRSLIFNFVRVGGSEVGYEPGSRYGCTVLFDEG